MWLYLLIFIIPVIAYYQGVRAREEDQTFLICFLAGLALFVGMSDMFGGYDRYIYGEVFDMIADTTDAEQSYYQNNVFDFFPGEPGYIWLNIIISWITANRYIFILILTLIVYTLLFISLRRYAENYPFALILFLGLWFYFTFTYLRQVLGATIVWLSIPYIAKRQFWKFLCCFLVAWSIHKSAILFFPMYFVPLKLYPQKTILTIMALALVVGISPIPNALFAAYGDASAVEQRADYNASGGFRVAYFIEAAFFLWLLMKKYAEVPDRPTDIVLYNIALVFCAVLLFFIRSENGGRLSWYYIIGLIITITNLVTKGSDRKNLSLMIIAVCLLLNMRIYTGWQVYLNLYPYKTFLTNSYREGDYSWTNYEYDHRYDKDKLYRAPLRLKVNVKLAKEKFFD